MGVLAAALIGGGCAPQGTGDEAPTRTRLGKGDLTGSCSDGTPNSCGGPSSGTCWCNESCVTYGDCCEDYQAVCVTASTDYSALCQQIEDGSATIEVLGTGSVLTKANWKKIDVLANMDYKQCFSAIKQERISVNGQTLWRFRSVEDYCDGGNTYGSIYTEDLTKAVAHIYDSDIYCDGWGAGELAENHKCDTGAELFAQQKMEAFGFQFEELSSSLQIRDPYVFSYVNVSGTLPDHGDRQAVVRVLTKRDDCTYRSPSIVSLNLDSE